MRISEGLLNQIEKSTPARMYQVQRYYSQVLEFLRPACTRARILQVPTVHCCTLVLHTGSLVLCFLCATSAWTLCCLHSCRLEDGPCGVVGDATGPGSSPVWQRPRNCLGLVIGFLAGSGKASASGSSWLLWSSSVTCLGSSCRDSKLES